MEGHIHCFQFSALANNVAPHLPVGHLSTRVRNTLMDTVSCLPTCLCTFTLSAVAFGLMCFPMPSPVLVFVKPFPSWPIQQVPKWHLAIALMPALSCIQQMFTEHLMYASTWGAAIKNIRVAWTSSQSMRGSERLRDRPGITQRGNGGAWS